MIRGRHRGLPIASKYILSICSRKLSADALFREQSIVLFSCPLTSKPTSTTLPPLFPPTLHCHVHGRRGQATRARRTSRMPALARIQSSSNRLRSSDLALSTQKERRLTARRLRVAGRNPRRRGALPKPSIRRSITILLTTRMRLGGGRPRVLL